MTLYDMAKQMVANEPPMDSTNFNHKVCEIATKMSTRKYWMLLCRERYDFSVFVTNNSSCSKISEELIPTLKNRGLVIFIDEQVDGVYEIWIRDPETKEDFAYYLFDYSDAIIEIED